MSVLAIAINAVIAIVVTVAAVCDVPYLVKTRDLVRSRGVCFDSVFAVIIHTAVLFAAVNIGASLLGQLYGFVAVPAVIAAVHVWGECEKGGSLIWG